MTRIVRLAASAFALLALAFLSAFAVWGWLYTGLPELEGRIALEGLEAPVVVRFDEHAVPAIEAQSEVDARFALGFLHARDRLWQMETQRRAAAGRLAEVVGEAALPRDELMRRLCVYRAAKQSYDALEPRTRAMVDAYVDGVNAFLATRQGPLPLEFQILGFEPEPWRPADSLAWSWLISLQLGENYHEELVRAALLQRHPAETVGDLFPHDADLPPARLHPELQSVDFAGILRDLPPSPMAAGSASNQWVLSGALTRTGEPLLANDPHLALDAPILWYLARIDTPSLTAAGATVPGTPFHVIGHNGRIAWGITAAGSDVQDLFVERIDPEDPGRYLVPGGGSQPFDSRRETIRVKGGEDVEITVRETRHGPVLAQCQGREGEPRCAVALSFGDLGPNDAASGLHRLGQAGDRAAFVAAVERLEAGHVNIGYADRGGTVGFYSPGNVPVRSNGHGRTPKPGWTGGYGWRGFVPFDELPHAFDPPSGRFVNANDSPVGEDYPHFLAASFEPAYRADRIARVLDGTERPGVEEMRRLQLDVVSLAAREMIPVLLAAKPRTDRGRQMLSRLETWDGMMRRDQPEPLIYNAIYDTLGRLLLEDELGRLAAAYGKPDPGVLQRLLKQKTSWCDDARTGQREDCDQILATAVDDAGTLLAQRYGSEPEEWRWGEAHSAPLDNAVVSRIPLLARLLDLEALIGGGDHTVARAASPSWPEVDFAAEHGAGFRAIYNFEDLDGSMFMIATGQSGNPLSSHYGDLLSDWRDGKYLTLPSAEDGGAYSQRLVLIPADFQEGT